MPTTVPLGAASFFLVAAEGCALTMGTILAVAGGIAFWVTRPAVPFDVAFQGCEEEKAEWRLIVNYSVDGIADDEESIAHFRRREPPKTKVISGSWVRWWEPNVIMLEDVGGSNCRWGAMYACGGGGGYSQHWHTYARENATGVDLDIEYTRSRGSEDVTAKESLAIPFRETSSGRTGKIDYRAKWENLKLAEI